MKKFICILAMIFNLTGCAGITFSRNGDVAAQPDLSPVDFEYRKAPPLRKADKINSDGTESYIVYEETKWCGLTIWVVIVPIPLWIPVCHDYTEVIYKNGRPITASIQRLHTFAYLCGPLMPMFEFGDRGHTICQWDD